MSFKKWLEDYEKAFAESVMKNAEKQGLKLRGTTVIIPSHLDKESRELFTAYRIERTNRRLVWATWGLAIATIILAIISIIIK